MMGHMTMWRMAYRCLQVSALVATLLLPSAVLADDAPKRPEWCKPGYVCLQTTEIVADAEYHLDLREQVAKYRARSSRFGFSAGIGIGLGATVDENFHTQYAPVLGAFVIYGIRW